MTSARALRGKTFTIGVVASDIHNPFFADVTVGISRRLEGTSYRVLLGFSLSSGEAELSLVEAMLDRQVDGLIWIAPRVGSDALDSVARKLPMVVVAFHEPRAATFDTANVDDELGARLAIDHLVATGHRQIAMLSVDWPATTGSVVQRREKGYLSAMETHGLAEFSSIERALETAEDIEAVASVLLDRPHPLDAIFCWNDLAALELLSVINLRGLRVPKDVAIIGFDNISACRLAQNSLSSVDQFADRLGEHAAAMLLDRIDGNVEPRKSLIKPALVVRGSTATG